MKDRALIELTLRAFKGGHITLEDAVTAIYNTYDNSKRFHFNSFWWGIPVGAMLILLWMIIL